MIFMPAEFAMSDADGKLFATGLANVARHYNIETTQKTVDWAAFACVLGTLYAPRWGAYATRRRAQAAARAAGAQGPAGPPGPAPFTPAIFPVPLDPQSGTTPNVNAPFGVEPEFPPEAA